MIGKSWLTATYAMIRAILFPGSRILIISSTKKQATELMEQYIVPMMKKSDNFNREVWKYVDNSKYTRMYFWNGSIIAVSATTDSARGMRSNVLIADEHRMIPKALLEKVFVPMLTAPRNPGYLNKESSLPKSERRYEHLREENIQIYLSSSWYASHWMYDQYNEYMDAMLAGKPYGAIAFSWELSVYSGFLTKAKALADKASMDSFTWLMEYCAIFVGANKDAFFNFEELVKRRVSLNSFIPPTILQWQAARKKKAEQKPWAIKRMPDEKRIISTDVARVNSTNKRKNDTTVHSCIRLLPNGKGGYNRHLVYLETVVEDDLHFETQAIRIKQLFKDFDADYAVIDANGLGAGLYDMLTISNHDGERGEDYPSWKPIRNDLAPRPQKFSPDSPAVIYPIIGNPNVNHEVATGLMTAIQTGKLHLLKNEQEAEENLNQNSEFIGMSAEDKAQQLLTFRQTDYLINELVNLKWEQLSQGKIKIVEAGNATKDRYSSLGYGNYVADLLEKEILKPLAQADTLSDACAFVTGGFKNGKKKKKKTSQRPTRKQTSKFR